MDSLISNYSDIATYSRTENGTAIVNAGEETDKDLFLKLLVAQMVNQDPFNPQDPTEFVTQLAMFNVLEQTMYINEGMSYLIAMGNGMLVNSAMSGATALIGKEVEVYAPEDEAGDDYGEMTYTGTVESVHIKDGIVYMNIRIDETGELKSIEYGALIKVNGSDQGSGEDIEKEPF